MAETDLELLSRYTRDRAEEAFGEIVRRHLDLVFSAALRQVRSWALAEEICQCVFSDLARQARTLAPDTVLSAWLHQVTRRTAIDVVRREVRRQSRERAVSEMNATDTTTEDWAHIEPLLDEAVHALEEVDRAVILLRYFESKPLRDVGQLLGISEDAARKRVSRAVDRLREFFAERGVTIGASGLAVAIASNSVQAAPVQLFAAVSAGAIAAGAVASSTAVTAATKTIAMITLQKTFVSAIVIGAIGLSLHEARKASTLQNRQQPLMDQLQQIREERDAASNRLAVVLEQNAELRRDSANLPRLRGELQRASSELAKLKQAAGRETDDPSAVVAGAWAERAKSFKQWFQEHPDKSIPELQLLREDDWLFIAQQNEVVATNRHDGNTIEMIASELRQKAKDRLALILGHALSNYAGANGGMLPDSLAQLGPYFAPPGDNSFNAVPIDRSILQRYDLLHTGELGKVPRDEPIIAERSAVDPQVDELLRVNVSDFNYASVGIIDNMAGRLRSWDRQDVERIKPFLR